MEAGGQAPGEFQTQSSSPLQDPNQLKILYEQKLSLLQSKLEQESRDRDSYASRFSFLNSDLESQKNVNFSLQIQIQTLNQELNSSKAQIQSLTDELSQFSEQKRTSDLEREQLFAKFARMQDDYKLEVEKLKTEIQQAWQKQSTAENERDAAKFKLKEVVAAQEQSERERELERAEVRSIGEEIKKMKQEFDRVCEQNMTKSREIECLKTELQIEVERAERVNQNHLVLKYGIESKLQEKQAELDARIREVEQVKHQIFEMNTSLQNERGSLAQQRQRADGLEQELQTLKRDYEDKSKYNNMLVLKNQKLMKDMAEVQEKYKGLTVAKTVKDVRELLNDSDIKKYHEEISENLKLARSRKEDVEKFKAQQKLAQQQIQEYQKLIIDLQEAYKSLSKEHKQLQIRVERGEESEQQQQEYIASMMHTLQERHRVQVEQQTDLNYLFQIVQKSAEGAKILGEFDQRRTLQASEVSLRVRKEQDLLQELATLNQSLVEQRIQSQRYQEKCEQLEQSLDKLSTELEESEEKLLQMRQQLQQSQGLQVNQGRIPTQQHPQSVTLITEQLESIQKIYAQDLDRLKNELSTLRDKLQKEELQNMALQSELDIAKSRVPFDPLKHSSKEQIQALEKQLKEQVEKVKQVETQQSIEKGKNGLLQMRMNMETSSREKLQKEIQELKDQNSKLNEEVKELQKIKLEHETRFASQSGEQLVNSLIGQEQMMEGEDIIQETSVQTRQRGQSLDSTQIKVQAEIIQKMREEKDELHARLRVLEIEKIQHDTVAHNQKIMIQNEQAKVKAEQAKNQELQNFIKHLQESLNGNDLISVSQGSQRVQGVRAVDEGQRVANELKDLLIQQKDQYELQISEREKIIDDLRQLILDNNRVHEEQKLKQTAQIEEISQIHASELQNLLDDKERLHNDKLSLEAQNADLQLRIDTFMNEREKLLITDEMKNEELRRLQQQEAEGQSRGSSQIDTSVARNFNDRLNNLQLKVNEQNQQHDAEISELKVKCEALQREKQLLNEEIDSQKESISLQKKEIQALTALLYKLNPAQSSQDQMEVDSGILSEEQLEALQRDAQDRAGHLILRERLNKAETEVETLRAQLLSMNEKNRAIQTELNKVLALAERHAIQAEEVKMKLASATNQTKMLEEANTTNKQLQGKIEQLQKEISHLQSERQNQAKHHQEQIQLIEQRHQTEIQQVAVNAPQQLAPQSQASQMIKEQVENLSEQLNSQQTRYDELVKEFVRQSQEGGGVPGLSATQISEAQRQMFKLLYGSLQRAKSVMSVISQVLDSQSQQHLDQLMGAGIEQIADGSNLGKRKKSS